VIEFGRQVLNGFYYFRVTMPGGVDGDARGEVEELVAVDVGDADAAAGFGDHGVAAGVAGEMRRSSRRRPSGQAGRGGGFELGPNWA